MAWVAVNKDGAEFIYDEKPTRGKNDWEPAIIGQMPSANDWGEEDYDNIYDDYYEGLMKKYNSHPLIQTLIVHNVNWRMNEGFLKEKDLVNIRKNLKKSRFFIIW